MVLDSLGHVWRWVHRVWVGGGVAGGGPGCAAGFPGLGLGLGLGFGGRVICITLWGYPHSVARQSLMEALFAVEL